MTQVGAPDRLAALVAPLEWLDGLLSRAIEAARAAYGDDAAADPHRGLYVGVVAGPSGTGKTMAADVPRT